jgi:hypothetical protein
MAKNGSTAPYQASLAGGLFGFLGRLFVTTPAYRGDGQPQPQPGGGVLGGVFGGGTPAYRPAPPEPPPVSEPATPAAPTEEDEPSACDGESGALTIVIARD